MIVSIYEHSSFNIHRGIDNHATQVLTARMVNNLIPMHIHSTFFIPHAFLINHINMLSKLHSKSYQCVT